jgi:pimeloyl-ACP methyl ester carboxylesterase
MDALAAEHTVVTYDPRGIGHSWPIEDSGVTIAQLADDAHALLAALALGPAAVVGASLGAAVALELALRHPGVVRGLVLITPIVDRDARFEAVLGEWRTHDAPASAERVRAMLPWLLGRDVLAHPGKRAAAAAAWRSMATRTPAASLRHHADALLAWCGTRAEDLGRITVPALVVAGADDVLTPPAGAEAVARRLPRAHVEILDGAGHALALERSAELNALLRAWLARELA